MTQPPGDLTAAVFRALYTDYDLRTHAGLHVVTPKGTPVFISPSLGQIARHLSTPGPITPRPRRRSQPAASQGLAPADPLCPRPPARPAPPPPWPRC
jgi:hypothetical protein